MNIHIRRIAYYLTATLSIAYWSSGWAAYPVYDAYSAQNQTQQLANMVQQIQALRQQLQQAQLLVAQARQQYNAFMGMRNLGVAHYRQQLYQSLPAVDQLLFDHTARLSQAVQNILDHERLDGEINQLQPLIEQRSLHTLAGHLAINANAYEIADQRLGQLERLMSEINKAIDPKAIADLQARISIEQAFIQNEYTKIQLMSQMQNNKMQLINQQKNQLSERILNPRNTAMPKLR